MLHLKQVLDRIGVLLLLNEGLSAEVGRLDHGLLNNLLLRFLRYNEHAFLLIGAPRLLV